FSGIHAAGLRFERGVTKTVLRSNRAKVGSGLQKRLSERVTADLGIKSAQHEVGQGGFGFQRKGRFEFGFGGFNVVLIAGQYAASNMEDGMIPCLLLK